MPKNTAQWTGFAVTLIIVLGRDADVLTAVPLGIAAGMLAALFQAAMRMQLRPALLFAAWRPSREQVTEMPALPEASRRLDLHRSFATVSNAVRTYRPKRRHAQFRE